MQEQILERNPNADIRVYVVWLPVLPSDERFGVANVLVDDRARHYWDDRHVVSDEVARLAGADGRLAWDVFLVFGPDATWDDHLPAPSASAGPVVVQIDALQTALRPYL